MPTARCLGCGRPLGDAERCRSCGTPAVGASLGEPFFIGRDVAYRFPQRCCCCLDRTLIVDEEVQSASTGGRMRTTVRFGLPWCAECRSHRSNLRRLVFGAGVVAAILTWLVLRPLVDDGSIAFMSAFAGLFVGALVAYIVLPLVVPWFRLPGHAPACDAVDATVTRDGARLKLANRAFGRMLQALSRGTTDDPIVRELIAEDAAERARMAAVPAPSPRDVVKDRALVAEAVRDEARRATNAAAHGYGRNRSGIADLRVAADTAAEVLRFVAKECTLDRAQLSVRFRDGSVRAFEWSSLARVAVRQLPEGPPFERAMLLDLVPRGAAPVRLLASTRANYAALPGSGVTSQENFRRVIAHLRAVNPAIELDPGTVAFASGRAPSRFDTIDELHAYDAGYEAGVG
jgi:hypothetical protein